MNSEEMTDTPATNFLMDFVMRKGMMTSPDDNLQKLRSDRWLDTWDEKVKGMPSMDLLSDARYPNYA